MRYCRRTLWSSGALDVTLLPCASFLRTGRRRQAARSCRELLASFIALRHGPDSPGLTGTTWRSLADRDDRASRRLSPATGNRRSGAAGLGASQVPGDAYKRSKFVMQTPAGRLPGAHVLSVEPSTTCEVQWTSPGASPVSASCFSLGLKCTLRATTGISQPSVLTHPLGRWFSNAVSHAARQGSSAGQKPPTLLRTRGWERQGEGASQSSPDTASVSLPTNEGDSIAMRTGSCDVPRTVAGAAKWKPPAVHLKNQQQVVVWKNNKTCVVCKVCGSLFARLRLMQWACRQV